MPIPGFANDLTNFLLVRGKYSWIGYSWVGCSHVYERPAALDTDYGVPLGLCHETAPGSGVFEREWSKANVSMDCGSWTGLINGKKAAGPDKPRRVG